MTFETHEECENHYHDSLEYTARNRRHERCRALEEIRGKRGREPRYGRDVVPYELEERSEIYIPDIGSEEVRESECIYPAALIESIQSSERASDMSK